MVAPAPTGERGSGLLGTLFGLTLFFVLLLFAVQLVLNLYATSVVTAVGFDAARILAGGSSGSGAARDEQGARAHVDRLLGAYGRSGSLSVDFSYGSGPAGATEVVHLHLRATHPTRLLPDVPFPYQTVDRTITVRTEEVR